MPIPRNEDANTSFNFNDFKMDIALGKVAGHSSYNKFGENPDMGTSTPEDIWDGGGVYTFSNTANINTLVSDDNSNTQNIYVEGLDNDFKEQSEIVTLNGTVAVNTTLAYRRVHRMVNAGTTDISSSVYCVTAGTSIVAGEPQVPADIRAIINNGNNQTLMCIYTVPAGKTALFTSGYVAFSRGVGGATPQTADFSWKARVEGSVFAVKSKIGLTSSGASTWRYTYGVPVKLPEKTDIKITCEDSSVSSAVSGGFDLVLIDNSFLT